LIPLLVITGHFLAYTFVRPILQDDGIDDNMIGGLLLAFGVAGICGNFIAGALIAKRLHQTVLAISLLLALAMVLLALVDTGAVTTGALLILWSLGYGAMPVTFQTWILDAAPDATEAASSLYPRSTCPSRSGRSSGASPSTASPPRACCGSAPSLPS
jgi:predicted MFS family arabinose efflux permease